MYRALYRKWRPRDFDDVCGQEQVTDILKYQISQQRFSHAYLFCGSRGTGKTSCAKILAKAVNCLHPVGGNPCNECEACRSIDAGMATDVIEMDAASNNGVDNVRDMKEEIVFTPTDLKYRVYIIDEVHMMSGSAFNALLKTLEEPPSYVLFILATTELNKLPATIISRCQRYDFRRLTSEHIISRLNVISEAEKIPLRDSGARLIARMAQGGMRDAISLLELCAGMNEPIDETLAAGILGIGSRDTPGKLVDAILNRDYPALFGIIDRVISSSEDLVVFWGELIGYYRDLVVVKTLGDAKEYLDLTDGEQSALSERAIRIPMAKLLYHSRMLEETYDALRRSGTGKRSIAELALTRMCEPKLSTSPESLLARLEELEKQVSILSVGEKQVIAAVSAELKDDIPAQSAAGKGKPAEPVKPDPPKEPHPDAKPDSKQNFKPLAVWNAVLEEFGEMKSSARPFLNGSQATISQDGHVTVSVPVSFFLGMLQNDTVTQNMLISLLKRNGEAVTSLEFVSAKKAENETQIEF